MFRRSALRLVVFAGPACALLLALAPRPASADAAFDAKQETCKAAMNARIQVCTDDCTQRALRAASNYVDKNNNVKFGCLKGCAIGQILQLRACVSGKAGASGDPTETNQH